MKKVLSLVLAAALAASLSACGGVLVDLDTPKSEELTAQYDFYPDAMNTIRADMKITPEQADEVFIVLTSCGLDGKITSISESNGAYTVYYGGSSLDVALSDGAVEAVYSGRDMLYPEYHKHNVLMDYDLTVKDVKTGSGDKIGEYAYIRITKAQLQAITEENYKEFVETVVKDSGYNWVAILCDDGDLAFQIVGKFAVIADFQRCAFCREVFAVSPFCSVRVVSVFRNPCCTVQPLPTGTLDFSVNRADVNVKFRRNLLRRIAAVQAVFDFPPICKL